MRFPDVLYHYTVGPKLPLIFASQSLKPSGFGLARSTAERPILWWSASDQWEPTATKIISTDGGKTMRHPSLAELESLMGLYRFCVQASQIRDNSWDFHPNALIVRKAKMHPSEAYSLITSGLKMGARPIDWWGTLSHLPVADMELESKTAEGWAPVLGGLERAAHFERQRTANMVQKSFSDLHRPPPALS